MFSILLIVSLFSLCLAQILSLHPQDVPFSNNALVEHTHPQHRQHRQYNRRYPQPDSDPLDNIDLLDIILLASVDGKFHALNRTSGHVLWSMGPYASSTSRSDTPTATPSGPSPLSPLVRTDHIDYDPEITDDTTTQEMYIIEPQSGDIYVMPNPSSPLQRFPFTMQELVDMSPFSFDGEEDGRVFVGKKETSLLVVELETGRIKATLNSECPWDQFEEFRKGEGRDELDLDELDGSKLEKQPTTDVYIGRTDYRVSIITRPNPSSGSFRPSSGPSNLIQNLSFSTYGPNRQDNHMQSLYRRTKDNTYIQPLPSGEIMSFKAQSAVDPVIQSPVWALNFSQPIVAIFDVLRKKPTTTVLGGDKGVLTRNPHPFVLLQPRPKLQDLFPNLPSSMKQNLQTAYVGLVTETGSLFAMSPQNFPLVVFGRNDKRIRMIDSGSSSGGGKGWSGGGGSGRVRFGKGSAGGGVEEQEEPTSVDELTKLRKLRGAGLAEPQDQNQEDEDDVIECHEEVMNDRRCLVGVRRMEINRGDGAETRMKRLLDASPSAMQYGEYQEYLGSHPPYPPDSAYSGGRNNNGEAGNESREPLITIDPPHVDMTTGVHAGIITGGRMWEAVCATIVLGFITFRVLTRGETWRKALGIETSTLISPPTPTPSQPQPPSPPQAQTSEGKEEVGLDSNDASELITSTLQSESDIPTPATIPLTPSTSTHSQTSIPTPITPSTPSTIIPDTPGSGTLTPTPATSGMSGTGTAPEGEETDKEDMDGANTDVGEDDFVVVDGAGKPNGAAAPETGDAPVPVTPKKKRTRRGGRGAKKPKNAVASGDAAQPNGSAKGGEVVEDTPTQTPPSSLVVTSTVKPVVTPSPSLTVSDTVLGYGSHGTVVYKGSLQGRAVAVKRLLADFVTLASREVSILQESDDHPNVIRYYYQEAHAGFLYIALELCPASLADLIETPDRDAWREIAVNFDPKRALRQITNGLRHLHGLKLVHRDIKPQNILVSVKTSGAGGEGGGGSTRGGNYRMLISDFGLCKKLEVDQTSFLPTAHGAMAAGTVGWRAPEILSGEVKLNEFADDQSQSSRGSTATVQGGASSISSTSSNSSANGKGRTRLTKSVDIFALGCLYYYTLTGGGHPFGDRYEREVNIMKNAKSLEVLERFGEEGTEAVDLIEKMLDPLPSGRPDTTSCLLHPFFWDSSRRLNFLQDASDRFEIMCRDPKDPNLLILEDGAMGVVGNDWYSRLDKVFVENLGKFRKYDGRSVQDLLRALRNKKHHYQDLPDNVKRHLGPMPDGYLAYFTRRFPNLFLHVHRVVKETGLEDESMFRSYFELPDS